MFNKDFVRFLLLSALVLALLLVGQLFWTRQLREGPGRLPGETPEEIASAIYVGRSGCTECHAQADSSWVGSDHDQAMMVPIDKNVAAAFDNQSFEHYGVRSTFFRRGDEFWVETDGPDGELREFKVEYTFGIRPLQQFLLPLEDGRLQALNVCWDTRPEEDGGQRWFHLYPDYPTPSTDMLHWTRRYQNWNFSCAECHSTNLQKNYDPETDSYATTYSEVNVSCEACHGPGSVHVEWARALERSGREADSASPMGLVVKLKDPNQGYWTLAEGESIATRSVPLADRRELDTCARCHSRRSVMDDSYANGAEFLDHYRPALLDERFYYADGQILDEVYVYGSFLQSKMYRHDVTCSDCHDTHSYKLLTEGDTVCGKCHHPEKYDAYAHHFHPQDKGDSCTDCHMVESNYMVVDPRRDHSFRNPRPDLSAEMGIPNSCNRCHDDKSIEWSLEWMDKWYGQHWREAPEFARRFAAARNGRPGAELGLAQVIADTAAFNPIVRATAMAELEAFPGETALACFRIGRDDPDGLVRMAVADAASWVEAPNRVRLLGPLLDDPLRAVRISAGRALADIPVAQIPTELQEKQAAALDEFVREQWINADRASSLMKLGALRVQEGNYGEAERLYLKGIKLEPLFSANSLNLSDLYRAQGREHEAEVVLRQALRLNPEEAALYYSLGLSLVRQRRYEDSVWALGEANRLLPEEMNFAYAHSAALEAVGRLDDAQLVLLEAQRINAESSLILRALYENAQRRGDMQAAESYLLEIQRLMESGPPSSSSSR